MNTHKNLLIVLGEWWEQRRVESSAKLTLKSQSKAGRLIKWLTPNGGTLLIVLALVLTQSVWARNLQSPAAPGPSATTVNYQGRLANNSGNPLSGTFGMTFAIFNSSTGGNLMWGPESHAAVPVSNGLFSVGLGSQTAGGIPTTVWNGDRYLEITVSGETLSPRELIHSVPIAGMALTVPDGAITSDKLRPTAAMIKMSSAQSVNLGPSWTAVTVPQTIFTINVTKNSRVFLWFTSTAQSSNFADRDMILRVNGALDTVSSVTAKDSFNFSGSTVLDLAPGMYTIRLDLQGSFANDRVNFPAARTTIMYQTMAR